MVDTVEGEPVADADVVVVGSSEIGRGTEMVGGTKIAGSLPAPGFWDSLVAAWSAKDPWQSPVVVERREPSWYCTWKLFKKVRYRKQTVSKVDLSIKIFWATKTRAFINEECVFTLAGHAFKAEAICAGVRVADVAFPESSFVARVKAESPVEVQMRIAETSERRVDPRVGLFVNLRVSGVPGWRVFVRRDVGD